MVDTEMWEHRYNESVAEIKKIQDAIKIGPLEIGGYLAKMHEACNHLPDKKFLETIREDLDIKKDQAYRYMKVYKELEWWPELVYNLPWGVLGQIIKSDLPHDWKIDFYVNGDPNLKDKDWKKFFKDWTEGKIKLGDPDFEAMKRHKSEVDEYHQQRKIERTEYVPFIQEQITTYSSMIDSNLTLNEAGKLRAREIASFLIDGLKELASIMEHNSVPPTFKSNKKILKIEKFAKLRNQG